MKATAQKLLERFAFKGPGYGRLTGVSLACHAIPDAFLVLHTGVGCKYKGAAQIRLHDLARPSHHGEGYTEVTDAALIKGSSDRLGAYVRSWYQRRKPSFMAVTTSTFLEMTGESFAQAVARAAETVPCETAYVPCLGFDGDLYDGYADLTLAVWRRIPFRQTKPVRKRVAILGYPFDRYELDHAANLEQIRELLGAIGLELGPVLLSGRPFEELRQAASCGTLLALPYARRILPEARRLAGRPVVETELPVGIQGTIRWLRAAARAAGVPQAAADAAMRRQLGRLQPSLGVFRAFVRENFKDARLAVFADTPLAAGLAALARELGLEPALVGLRDASLGGRRAFAAAGSCPGSEVLESPSLQAVRDGVGRAVRRSPLLAVIGSTSELRELSLDPELRARSGALLELGFPSVSYHALAPAPYYGIAGVLSLCHRLMNQALPALPPRD
jgi:nitrogenase molybdenum-iron protein alpha/beta subunit